MTTPLYVGRFAPSPTGHLHFGSLLAALASFLDARAHQGRWLLRIEDIDPPRTDPTALVSFPRILEDFELFWDGEIRYQSQRTSYYLDVLADLKANHFTYPCVCSRKQISARTDSRHYDRFCLSSPPDKDLPAAIRLKTAASHIKFNDQIQGQQTYALGAESGDFVLHRKDGLFSYQLAVVADDVEQGITHIVRGSDLLLPETPRHIFLQQALKAPTPIYAHIPVITHSDGQKLSKQSFAPALTSDERLNHLHSALCFLGHPPEHAPNAYTYQDLLHWAIEHWHIRKVPATLSQYQPLH